MSPSALVRSAVATSVGAAASAAVLLVAHREQLARRAPEADAGGACPMRRVVGRVPAPRTADSDRPGSAVAFPEYSV